MSGSAPNWPLGYVPSAAEWNAEWALKADVTGGTIVSPVISGATITSSTWIGGTITGLTSPLPAASGGTGVNNGSSTITLGGAFVTSGGSLTFTLSGATNITLPTSGTFLSNVLASAKILLGNGSNVATAVTPSGDWTMTNAGVSTVTGATGAFTPSQTLGIVGTTTNNSANAGSVGEFVSATVLIGSEVALTSGTSANITSISLTAGDWDVYGSIIFDSNAATVVARFTGWTSSTSATQPTRPNNGGMSDFIPGTSGTFVNGDPSLTIGSQRFLLSGTTTVFLSANANFTVNTLAAYGFIGARRRR